MATGKGVDFSPRWQKDTPIPPDIEYAWIKVADGSGPYRIVPADAMVARFKARGIPLGGYSYAQPGDGAAHARVLIAECRRLGILDLVPVTDIESDKSIHTWSTAEAIAYGKAFANECARQGFRSGVYMSASLAGATRPDQWGIPGLVIWIARYGAKPEAAPAGAQYLGRYDVHQYTKTPVDTNQSYTNAHFLTASGGGGGSTQGEDMDSTQDQLLREIHLAHYGTGQPIPGLEDRPGDEAQWEQITDIQEKVTALAAGPTTPAEPLDYAKLAKALLTELANPTN